MKKMYIKSFYVITLLFVILNISSLFAQKTLDDCASITPNCTNWSPWYTRTFDLRDFECVITLEYRWCWDPITGTRYFQYRNISVTGNCLFMENFSIFHYSFSGLTELIDILMIQDHENDPNIPDCPNTYHLVKSYVASCGIWIKCTYELDPNVQPQCECGWQGPPPDYVENGVRKVDVWRWQPCGNTCCEKTYEVCQKFNTTHNERRVIIKAVSKQRLGECSGNESGPCQHGQYDRICEDGC